MGPPVDPHSFILIRNPFRALIPNETNFVVDQGEKERLPGQCGHINTDNLSPFVILVNTMHLPVIPLVSKDTVTPSIHPNQGRPHHRSPLLFSLNTLAIRCSTILSTSLLKLAQQSLEHSACKQVY